MRQIKFRGKHKATRDWVYGDLEHLPNNNIHIFGNHASQPVTIDTVGQFTGLLDRNGKEIYEGDVVFWRATDMRGRGKGEQGAIFWDKHTMSWAIERDKPCADGRPCIISRPFDKKHLEVVGNIHDNPELMKHEQYEKL